MKTNWKTEWKALAAMAAVFFACFYLPVGVGRFDNALREALELVKWYAREHVVLCLIPAFFIAGAIGVFVSQASVMKYLGPKANKTVAYGVASVSGTILAVCSCTVLPLFAGIWRMGAGLGPATAFLYSGPAINVLAIILTARILGLELGIARAVGAVGFSVVIGLMMHFIYRKEEHAKAAASVHMPEAGTARPLWQTVSYFAAMVGILVFANWGKPDSAGGFWHAVWQAKWIIAAGLQCGFGSHPREVASGGVVEGGVGGAAGNGAGAGVPEGAAACLLGGAIGLSIITSTSDGEPGEWFSASWTFARQILPLLFWGVLTAGLLLGRPGNEGLIPNAWVTSRWAATRFGRTSLPRWWEPSCISRR